MNERIRVIALTATLQSAIALVLLGAIDRNGIGGVKKQRCFHK